MYFISSPCCRFKLVRRKLYIFFFDFFQFIKREVVALFFCKWDYFLGLYSSRAVSEFYIVKYCLYELIKLFLYGKDILFVLILIIHIVHTLLYHKYAKTVFFTLA